jgi:uridine phosphorylase
MAAELLAEPRWLNDERGLTTVTGIRDGQRVTVTAFGMGAPVAAVVLHELAAIGVDSFVRLGTALTLPPAGLGDLVLADGAVRGESTSATYLPIEFPALPDPALAAALRAAAQTADRPCVSGLIASYDGFYTQMFAAVGARVPESQAAERRESAIALARRTAPRLDDLARLGVVGLDMETSAILVVARALGVRAAALCLGSVDGLGHGRLDRAERVDAERELLEIGIRGLLQAR